MYEFEFKFSGTDFFVRTDVTPQEAMDCIKTGLLRNKEITEIKLFSVENENPLWPGKTHATFVYSVVNAKAGQQPWSLVWQ